MYKHKILVLIYCSILVMCSICAYAIDVIDNVIEEFITNEEGDNANHDVQNSIGHKSILATSSATATTNSDRSNEFIFQLYDTARIIALNKITAKSMELTLHTGSAKYFGNIEIKVHKCVKNLNPYSLDNNALLTVIENKIDEDQLLIFQGWISSANISISTLEHPVYEVFVKECL